MEKLGLLRPFRKLWKFNSSFKKNSTSQDFASLKIPGTGKFPLFRPLFYYSIIKAIKSLIIYFFL